MSKIRFSTNFTVFLLFFGVAMLDAFRDHDLLKSLFWIIIALVFLLADSKKRQTTTEKDV